MRRAALHRLDVPEPESLERGQVETADGTGDVGESVGPLVAELCSVRQFARSDGVKDDDARSRHGASYPTSVADALGLVGIAVFIVCVVALAAGVTWLVVRLSPSPDKKNKPAESG